jgi:hypothetical protein
MRTLAHQNLLKTNRLGWQIRLLLIGVLLLLAGQIGVARAEAAPLQTPEALTITVNANSIAVEWQITNESSVIFYTLHRSETNVYDDAVIVPAMELSSISESDPAVTTYTLIDATVQPGRAYHYWLTATDQQGTAATFGPLAASLVDDASDQQQHRLFLPVVTTR